MRNRKSILYICLLVLFAAAAAGCFLVNRQPVQEIPYRDFLTLADQDQVGQVILENNSHTFTFRVADDTGLYQTVHPRTDDFVESLLLQGIEVTYQPTGLPALVQVVIVAAIAAGIFIYIRYKKSGGLIQNTNKKKTENKPMSLDDVAGNAEAKAMVRDIVNFIKAPDQYTEVGAKMPRGVLFYGPPGTGKTLMAKAIAGQAGVPFYPMSGSDFVQMYVGVGASRIRDLFKQAKKSEKAVIFIDEIDAIGKKRGKHPSAGNDERDQTLNALLTELSGFHDRDGIVVIAATNRLDTLDEALVRPGRFDRQIEIGLPDINARHQILALHAADKPLAQEISLKDLARSTVSFSGAMLENLLNEAAIIAANDHQTQIEAKHLDQAFYTVIAGAMKSDTSYLTEQDQKITAGHEAGHALLTKLLLPDHYISKVTIIPSVRGAGGFSLSIPKDSPYMTKKDMEATIQVLLAGRAAEEILFGPENITTGAGNDIQKASRMICDYVNTYGMDQEYGIFYQEPAVTGESEHLTAVCRTKLTGFYADTIALLGENKDLLTAVMLSLLENESLSDDDILELCAFKL